MAKKHVSKDAAKRGSKALPKRAAPADTTAEPVIVGAATLPMFADGGDFVLTLNGRNLHAVDIGSLRLESELGTFTISRRSRPIVHGRGEALTIWGRYARRKARGGFAVSDTPPLNAGALTVVYTPPKGGPQPPGPKRCPFPILAFAFPFKSIHCSGRMKTQGALVDTYKPPLPTGTKKKGS